MKEKVLVGMSGGVDSSVAVALLQESGYEVVGITMRLWYAEELEKRQGCCSLDDVQDARRAAERMNVPHYTLNMKEAFRVNVVDYFVDEYLAGRTPNPCIACNRVLKFQMLLEKAKAMGINKVATGHYAAIKECDGRLFIQRGVDEGKDQSYFLFDIPPENLRHILFPLGGLTKDETRKKAAKLGLTNADKPESQEVCFVPDDDYKKFIEQYRGVKPPEGDFVDKTGKVLGRHKGIPFYTIGQRRGLGVSFAERLYVQELRIDSNQILLGLKDELATTSMILSGMTYHKKIDNNEKMVVQIRYRSKPVACHTSLMPDGKMKVVFAKPVDAVTPGQAAVFYEDDIVLGGGWVESFSKE